jgi:hypothetical protein
MWKHYSNVEENFVEADSSIDQEWKISKHFLDNILLLSIIYWRFVIKSNGYFVFVFKENNS